MHVICPGFSSDCLETLEEINMEGRHIFTENGGGEYDYIPALNDDPDWIIAMQNILKPHLAGWLDSQWSSQKQKKISEQTMRQFNKIKQKL